MMKYIDKDSNCEGTDYKGEQDQTVNHIVLKIYDEIFASGIFFKTVRKL